MLALYHLFADVPASQLPGMEAVTKIAGVSQPPKVRRAVLVNNRISPTDLHKKPDGTVVRTLWGELAWQLGGKQGYEMVRVADEKGISPGDSLRVLFKKFSPCLILIDEWVAYQHDQGWICKDACPATVSRFGNPKFYPSLTGRRYDSHFCRSTPDWPAGR
jgi:predicted AAA+ superfamily ATPase